MLAYCAHINHVVLGIAKFIPNSRDRLIMMQLGTITKTTKQQQQQQKKLANNKLIVTEVQGQESKHM